MKIPQVHVFCLAGLAISFTSAHAAVVSMHSFESDAGGAAGITSRALLLIAGGLTLGFRRRRLPMVD